MRNKKTPRKVHGLVITMEALMTAIFILILLAIAFTYAMNMLGTSVKLEKTKLDGTLCGQVLVLKNVGTVKAIITHAYGVDPDTGNRVEITTQLPQTVLDPGDEFTVTLQKAYTKIYIVGENFELVTLNNECTP